VIAALLPFSILIGVGLGEFGGTIVIAIVWGAIALRLSQPVRHPMPAQA
jgi:hypothetical protein